jgi:NAD(P)-dependent dehydrogenase (short-subunit alcohol dehydrogenase family)
VALITVDRQGLAEVVAEVFGREGASVAIADVDDGRLASITKTVQATGAQCLPLVMDPVNPESCKVGVAEIIDTFGRLDILCNLAGEFPRTGPLHEIDEAEFDRVLEANIKSALVVSRFAVPAIRESGDGGSIINLGHSATLDGVPGTALLAATKGPLLNMTRDMAVQGIQEGFRVNCVCVGSTFLPVVPSLMERHQEQTLHPEELAGTFVYLACDDSRHMNGHILNVDDGMHAWRDDGQRAQIVEGREIRASQPVPESGVTAAEKLLEGQVALITAGGGGIARATAQLFAREGARVVLADINLDAVTAVAELVNAAGGQAIAVDADATLADDCARAVEKTVERYGRLDVLVNLAGLFGKGSGTVDKVSLEEWDLMMDINLRSVFLMSKYALPVMIESGRGAIVNTGTVAAVIGRGGSPCYGACKSGVLSVTRAMAADYFEQGIRVNAVSPARTETAMLCDLILPEFVERGTPMEQAKDILRQGDQGLSTPEEIAPSFLFLASDATSRRTTGHNLLVDNGFSRMRL